MASSSRSGNALKNTGMFTAARRLRDVCGEWESLIACTKASRLCATREGGDELASENMENEVRGGGARMGEE